MINLIKLISPGYRIRFRIYTYCISFSLLFISIRRDGEEKALKETSKGKEWYEEMDWNEETGRDRDQDNLFKGEIRLNYPRVIKIQK